MKIKDLVNNSEKDGTEIDLTFTKNEKFFRLFLYILDTFLIALLYLFFGLGFSSFINAFICQQLDTGKRKLNIFFETTWESFAIIIMVFCLLFYIPLIPSIVPLADYNHLKFRSIAKHVVLAYAIVMAHERLLKKYRFLLGVDT